VETVRGYANQERQTLEAVVEARAKATQMQIPANITENPEAFKQFQENQAALSSSLARLLAVVENYPDLKSNQNFLSLQSQLEGTENRIAVERRRFNEAVREYNTRLNLFPGTIVARLAGFRPKAFFEAAPDAATPPKVKF
jgi:LemA protein